MGLMRLLARMVKFRPESGDVTAVNALVDFVRSWLKEHGLYTRVERLDGRKILYASTKRSSLRPPVLFNAHLDVVPARRELYRPVRKEEWLYGRGTADCLANCCVIMDALRLLGEAGAYGAAVFSTDEELGGRTTEYMVGKGYLGDVVLVLDAGGYSITTAQKGILHIVLRARGRSAHGAVPWEGRNAVDRLIDGYLRIRDMFPRVERKSDAWKPTLSLNVISGGTAVNKVPDEAECRLDIRFTEKEDPRDIVRRIREATGLRVEVSYSCPVTVVDPSVPEVRRLREIMRMHLGRPIRMKKMMGATDARFFAPSGVPVAMIGVPGEGAHQDAERVFLPAMEPYRDVLVEFCLWKGSGE